MTKTTSKRPAYTAYAVDGDGDKANWTEIGALWAHEDGKGYNLNLKALPVSGRVVIRQRWSETDEESGR